jgi:hypothetical protein
MNEPSLTLEEAKAVVATKVHPRVTEESIKDKIAGVDYHSHGLTTICFLRMKNGFVFIGHSTPADARNYDPEVGQRYAYDNAFKQIWTHEGYLLREKLSNG